jgi:SH3 type 3 domain protein
MKKEERKEIKKNRKGIVLVYTAIFLWILVIILLGIFSEQLKNVSYATTAVPVTQKVYVSPNIEEIDLENVIENNTKDVLKEKFEIQEIDLEYTTKYQDNPEIPKDMIQVLQEGIDGKQQIIIKKTYQNGELIEEKEVGTKVTKASVDKIVSVGTAGYRSNYQVQNGDCLYVTSDILAIYQEENINSQKLITINKKEKVTFISQKGEWYRVKYGSYIGYAKKDCLTYIDPNQKEGQEESSQDTYTKSQLLGKLSKNMSLNKPSGLSLEQFKKVLSGNSKDKNGVFEQNYKYFYYIEKQYNVNGIFVAAVGIHESAWGTSSISLRKKNLFGYGAYDRNPSDNAYSFDSYSEGIDLIARVFAKYYLNPKGTKIYNNEVATGSHYNGPTLTGVNTDYATDKNWANGVYSWMSYLYNRL